MGCIQFVVRMLLKIHPIKPNAKVNSHIMFTKHVHNIETLKSNCIYAHICHQQTWKEGQENLVIYFRMWGD